MPSTNKTPTAVTLPNGFVVVLPFNLARTIPGFVK